VLEKNIPFVETVASRTLTSASGGGGPNTSEREFMRRMTSGGLKVSVAALLLSAAPNAQTQTAPRVVTLITGDRVVVAGAHAETVSILPGAGREKMNFLTERIELHPGKGRHLQVIPEDALPLIAADQLDRRLFDITDLLAFEYDDAHRDHLPVIISHATPGGGPPTTVPWSVSPSSVPGMVLRKDLSSIHAVAATATKERIEQLWGALLARAPVAGGPASAMGTARADGIQKIWLDRLLFPVLDQSVPQIGAPAAWALGYEGDGVVVAVIDGGVDPSHPDLIDRIIVTRNFTDGSELDEDGHGTHVASTIAGTGAADGGRYRGVAPGAQLLSAKVCEGLGCAESAIVEAVQWAVVDEGARIVNMSLGGADTVDIDPLEQAVMTLTADYGALFVIAAGNDGPTVGSVQSPGSVDVALTVGAVDRADEMASFSSRGPVDVVRIKPDLTAPGVGIVAARAAGTSLGEPVDEWYTALSGTSMATPHVAGAAALLLQQHPDWGPAELKRVLMASGSHDEVASVLDQGGGRVDVAAAIATSLIADTSSIEFGLALWPHEDDPPLTRVVSFRNLGQATELSFEIDVTGPDGARPPGGMFTVTPATASVAEGGTVSVTITADTSVAAPDGAYGGRLIASDARSPGASTPLLVQKEVESYDLTLRYLDRRGLPTNDFNSSIRGRDSSLFVSVAPVPATPGERTVRLPKGRYLLDAYVAPVPGAEPTAYLLAPDQVIDGNRALVLDARAAKAVTALPPSPSATFSTLQLIWDLPGMTQTRVFRGAPFFYAGTIEPAEPELFSALTAEWFDASASPSALYEGSWSTHGALPAGVNAMERDELATVHATYAAPVPDEFTQFLAITAAPRGSSSATFFFFDPLELPIERTEYFYSQGDEIRWYRGLSFFGDGIGFFATRPTAYAAGQIVSHAWNQGPFTPLLFESDTVPSGAYRQRDTLTLTPEMYSDGDGYFYLLAEEALTTVYRDGEPVARAETAGGQFEVSPEPASFRVEVHHSQSSFQQSTEQLVAWTFTSAHVEEGEAQPLPLLTIDFEPPFDAPAPTPAGAVRTLPFDVAQFGRATPPDITTLAIEASYDDGATWADAPVHRDASGWSARLEPAPGTEYLSLRASAADLDGNAVEQSAIRAYRIATD
jgi:subtilisin family serine protease